VVRVERAEKPLKVEKERLKRGMRVRLEIDKMGGSGIPFYQLTPTEG